MNNLYDLLLTNPLKNQTLELLLFVFFALHILFVLLMLGTAMIALFFFVHSWLTGYYFELRWDKRVLRAHLGLKSLAVVLGVGPLLIIQLLWSVPFLTAASILAPYWLSLTGLMIIAFLSLDILGHKIKVYPVLHLCFGLLGLTAMLAIPAIFTAVLSLMERPELWNQVAAGGFSVDPSTLFHWLMRYFHIIGAAALFGGAFHYFATTHGDDERHYHLSHWIIVAALFQVLVGVLLLTSVMDQLTAPVITAIGVGVLGTVLLLGFGFYRNPGTRSGKMVSALVLLPVILISMLLARQFLQHDAIAPVQAELEAKADEMRQTLAPLQAAAQQEFKTHLSTVYDNGEVIYQNACAFCHGEDGRGNGVEAGSLIIQPEQLEAVRAEREHLYHALLNGIPGSGMPYFSIFDRPKLESLLDYLEKRFKITSQPALPDHEGDLAAPRAIFSELCSRCHGDNGEVSSFGQGLRPPPPDLRHFGLTPQRAFEVISEGYNGTVMQPFKTLPPETRWGLVRLIAGFRAETGKSL